MIKALFTFISIVATFINFAAYAQSNDCEWRERQLTITIFGNDELLLNADALAFTCDSEGKSTRNGWYVRIQNHGEEPLYYGAASIYGDRASDSFFKGTCINFNYYSIAPKSSKIIRVIEAKTKEEEHLMTHGVLRIKYCKPQNRPRPEDYTFLQKFKDNQVKYGIATSADQSTQQTASTSNNASSTECPEWQDISRWPDGGSSDWLTVYAPRPKDSFYEGKMPNNDTERYMFRVENTSNTSATVVIMVVGSSPNYYENLQPGQTRDFHYKVTMKGDVQTYQLFSISSSKYVPGKCPPPFKDL